MTSSMRLFSNWSYSKNQSKCESNLTCYIKRGRDQTNGLSCYTVLQESLPFSAAKHNLSWNSQILSILVNVNVIWTWPWRWAWTWVYVLFFKLQLTALLIVIKTCSVEPQLRLKNCNLTRVRRNGQPGASGVKFALLGSVFPLLRQCRREIWYYRSSVSDDILDG